MGTSPFCGGARRLVDRTIPAAPMHASEIIPAVRDGAPGKFNLPVPLSDFLTLRVEDRGRVMVRP
jgi:hypothetical protein